MRILFIPTVATAVILTCGNVRADGLVYQLPADGTWVRYTGEIQCTAQIAGFPTQKYNLRSSLTVSSVGEVTRNLEKCRWIELKMEVSPVDREADKQNHILKVLIPEKYLKRGEDPLAHVR